jgi:threonine dehydrogenase-like Zn-dependent dehydrogenase
MQNPSIVLYGAKEAKLEDKEIPELIDPHDVLVRIAYVGVCGSDVSPGLFYHGPSNCKSITAYPTVDPTSPSRTVYAPF